MSKPIYIDSKAQGIDSWPVSFSGPKPGWKKYVEAEDGTQALHKKIEKLEKELAELKKPKATPKVKKDDVL